MAQTTGIEWCDATLNLWWGCTKVSDGCKFCYADVLSRRFGKSNWGPKGIREEKPGWRKTLDKISKQAEAENRRLRVFCSSMADVFEGPDSMGGEGSENWRTVKYLQNELFAAVMAHPELDFLVLTKRPENVISAIIRMDRTDARLKGIATNSLPDNLWLGTSVEDQKTADERIPHLLKVPAAVRFLSCEPLLGEVDLNRIGAKGSAGWKVTNCLTGNWWNHTFDCNETGPSIHWVICGGESGPNARPMNPAWARSLRDQCKAVGVAFFFKQWGEWCPGEAWDGWKVGTTYTEAKWFNEQWLISDQVADDSQYCEDSADVYRIGKHKAGRLLDGVEYSDFPEVC